MKLSEMLDYVGAEYLDDRADLVDGDPDSLWSDKTIVRYLNDAQRILCRRAWVLQDEGTAEVGTVVLRTGAPSYPLHKSILSVLMATPEDQEFPLTKHEDAALRQSRPYSDDLFPVDQDTTQTSGRPIGYAVVGTPGKLTMRVYRTPSATEQGLRLLLKVVRMPTCWLEAAKTAESPEVPEEWHMALCDYAAGRCLTMPTVDSANKVDGRALLKSFDEQVWEARRNRQRAEGTVSRWAFGSTTSVLR